MDKHTRIAVLSHAHPSVSKGGAEISAYALFAGLQELGHSAHFIAACSEDQYDQVSFERTDEHLIVTPPNSYDYFYHVAHPEVTSSVEKLLRELQIDLVFAHHFLLFGINTIERLTASYTVFFTCHEFLSLCHNHGQMVTTKDGSLCNMPSPPKCTRCYPRIEPAQFAVRSAVFAEAFMNVCGFISPSLFLIEQFVRAGFERSRFHMIENGLLGRTGSENGIVEKKVIDKAGPRRKVIGFFGQLNPFKGIDLIIDAAEVLARDSEASQRVRFRVHGNIVNLGESLASRFNVADQNGLIEYRGPYEYEQVGDLMRQCDFVLMASKWWENSPVVIQEAFEAHRPLIVPDIGGTAEKVKARVNGLHFKWKDSADLARVAMEASELEIESFAFPKPPSAVEMAASYFGLARKCSKAA